MHGCSLIGEWKLHQNSLVIAVVKGDGNGLTGFCDICIQIVVRQIVFLTAIICGNGWFFRRRLRIIFRNGCICRQRHWLEQQKGCQKNG